MRLKDFKRRIDEMYERYGDVDVTFDFKTGGDGFYSFYRDKKLLTYLDEEHTPDEYFDSCFIEVIEDIQETYEAKGGQLVVNGICISNYVQEVDN